jgi:hypothetical protein
VVAERSAGRLRHAGAGLIRGPTAASPELRELTLDYNGLANLPSTVGEAVNLTSLGLGNNDFTHVPEMVWNLPKLGALLLWECPIAEIPPEILRLEKLTTLGLGDQFASGPNLPPELVSPPPEIAIQGLEAIKKFWRQQCEVGIDYLAEAKLLIVGEPGAGKTTLAKKLLDLAYVLDSGEQSTEGIDVSTWEFPSAIRPHTIAGLLEVLQDMNTLTEKADGFANLYRSLETVLETK